MAWARYAGNARQVTITAPDGLTSDPLSTALTILSAEDRRRLLEAYPRTAAYVRVLPPDQP